MPTDIDINYSNYYLSCDSKFLVAIEKKNSKRKCDRDLN